MKGPSDSAAPRWHVLVPHRSNAGGGNDVLLGMKRIGAAAVGGAQSDPNTASWGLRTRAKARGAGTKYRPPAPAFLIRMLISRL